MDSNLVLLNPLSQLLQQHETGSDSNSITLAAQVAFTTDNSTARQKIMWTNNCTKSCWTTAQNQNQYITSIKPNRSKLLGTPQPSILTVANSLDVSQPTQFPKVAPTDA